MKTVKLLCLSILVALSITSAAAAADFEWLTELNIRATSDLKTFRADLAARFNIGTAEVNAVISNVAQPADAYMALRLSEMSHQPIDHVMMLYREKKGWGSLAKDFGIKPGSKEFQALKRGHDLGAPGGGKGKSKGKGKKGR